MPSPWSSRHQVATSFIAGGYTPASATPVRNRRTIASSGPAPSSGIAPLAAAATKALTAKIRGFKK